METKIKVKATLKEVKEIFKSTEKVYIKFYKPSCKNFNIDEYDNEKIFFDINVRHNENEDAKNLFNNALKQL